MKRAICIDFDGCLYLPPNGWQGYDNIDGDPVPLARESIALLRQTYRVLVWSCRAKHPAGLRAMKRWFKRHQIRVDALCTNSKPVADVYIDDCALEFRGDWREILARLPFTPWTGNKVTYPEES